VLEERFRFGRRARSNPCDFREFLQNLQFSETIRTVRCRSRHCLVITEDDWILLVKTIGSIKDIQSLTLSCTPGSCDFHPFQTVADAVNSAHSLCKLTVEQERDRFPRDPSGLAALVKTLRDHTALEEFGWLDHCSLREAAQSTAVDPLLWALLACPHLRKVVILTKCASVDARKNLLRFQSAVELRYTLEPDHWLAVADEIRQGRCNGQRLHLIMIQGATPRSETIEALKTLASAIQLDCNLEDLWLQMESCFTDEVGVALAEALTVNKTLRKLTLSEATLGTQTYEAFSAILRQYQSRSSDSSTQRWCR
jgi:hypothetical protein